METEEASKDGEAPSLEGLQSRLRLLERREEELMREKESAEEEFRINRAKFRSLFIQKEEDLKRESEELMKCREIESLLRAEIGNLQREISDVKSEVFIAQCTKENEIEMEKRKCADEIATVQRLMDERLEEVRRSLEAKYEGEIRHLREKLETYRCNANTVALDGKDQLLPSVGPSVLSVVSKTFAKTVDRIQSFQNDDSKEDRKNSHAEEDAEFVRSLAATLEQEVAALKDKLRVADEQLRVYEANQHDLLKGCRALDDLTQMHEARLSLEKERKAHNEVKELLVKANENAQKLEQNRLLERKRLLEIFSPEQLKKFDGAPKEDGEDHGDDATAQDQGNAKSASPKANPSSEEEKLVDKQILVLEKEWNLLHHEVESAREKFVKSCPMCANYEIRLQDAQKDQKAAERTTKSLEQALERYKEDLNRESRYRKEMEEKWLGLSKEYERQATELARNLDAKEKSLAAMKLQTLEWKRSVEAKLRDLVHGREAAQKELNMLRTENDNLVGKHSAHSQELQNEAINFPDSVDELHELLLKYREDLISAKVAAEALHDTLKKERRMFKDRILAEKQEKQDLEESLHHELDELKERLFILEGVQEAYEREQKSAVAMRRAMDELKIHSEDNRIKDSQLIQVLKKSAEELIAEKSRLESEVHRLQCKNSGLTQDLNNSEAVQRDFVKLSQSLQVQLEKIRSSEKEVRWQDPEDVDECNSCHASFSRSKKKHNCKHCGKVFCPECTSKSVPSGSHSKPARVCDVCHTLLVSNTAPYFSTDPPHTPD
ncbi:unnamed protein product [Notodromas monacha]|uniref:FYVE-type domain-containing protein n=1 Tax=Notodromas monacha TaxID=399045 RepID=A0A7R9BTM0_9CRUS|nr:unnamed protein product [Notodromas monacha]CAG0921518.1 unnamed protein product [Notodromas monacha]